MAQPEPRYCYRHPDRETGLSCSECGRPICADCMTPAPVGIRCPEHSGRPQGVRRATMSVPRIGAGTPALVTRVLVGINVAVYALELAGGAGINANSGWIFEHCALFGPLVAAGDWWRLLTAAFLHYGPIHLGMNMLALWWFGAPIEETIGRARFLGLYLVSGLAGSAGALINQPLGVTVGASGAIFGIMGAAVVLERTGVHVFGGAALGLIAINLVITFALPGIAVGGHIGGLIGGVLAMILLLRFRRSLALSMLSLVALGALSVAIAYWKVRGYA